MRAMPHPTLLDLVAKAVNTKATNPNLRAERRTVTRNGRTFTTTVYVRQDKAQPGRAVAAPQPEPTGVRVKWGQTEMREVLRGESVNGMTVLSLTQPPEDTDRPYEWLVPTASLTQSLDELAGRSPATPPSTHPAVRLVNEGNATPLGRGNDGMVWRAGDQTVKLGGVTPYHPSNRHAYRTPDEARERIREHVRMLGDMTARGATGIPPTQYIEHAGRGYAIRDYLDLPDTLTAAQLRQAERHLASLHDAGYSVNDQLQFGLDRDGNLVHFDLGSAQPFSTAAYASAVKDRKDDDLDRLRSLFQRNNVPYVPRIGHGVLREAALAMNPLDSWRARDAGGDAPARRVRAIQGALKRAIKELRRTLTGDALEAAITERTQVALRSVREAGVPDAERAMGLTSPHDPR